MRQRARAKLDSRVLPVGAPDQSTKAVSYRARVLVVVNNSDMWQTGRNIALLSGLSYTQAIHALNGLYNTGQIARKGRTFTALWGSLDRVATSNDNFDLLQTLFKGFVKR
jgi:hypothetical protein